ncbi:MAG: hypothetical protein IJ422_06785 [Oscillospiraceae bacterium]|nr:hypothetical protein [Oscillospiraceae bacterium]
MARRKYEFKPDRPDGGLANRLYLTKKQRLSLLKWILFGLVLLVLTVLQDVVLCRFRIFGATTDLVPCAILLSAVLLGSDTGSVFCLIAACFYDFSGSAPGTYVIPLLTILGIGITIFRQSFLRQSLSAAMVCTAASVVAYELLIWAMGLFLGQTYLGRLPFFLLTAGLSLLAAPVLYPILRSIGKIGGETWKE